MKHPHSNSLSPVIRFVFACMMVAALALPIGCGGGGNGLTSNPGPTPTPAPGTSSMQIRFGDAPADSVIAFEVSVSALSLTPAGTFARQGTMMVIHDGRAMPDRAPVTASQSTVNSEYPIPHLASNPPVCTVPAR